MVNGFALGGFGSGLTQGAAAGGQAVSAFNQSRSLVLQREQMATQRQQEEERLKLMREQMSAEQMAEARKQLGGDIKGLQDTVKAIADNRGPDVAKAFLAKPETQRLIGTLQKRGVVAGFSGDITAALAGAIEQAATPEEAGKQAGQQAVAQAGATAEALGVPIAQTAQAQGLTPAPVQPRAVSLERAIDSTTGAPVFVTPEQIVASGGRYQPIPSGMKLEVGADGSVSLGTGEAGGMTTSTETKIQGEILDSADQLQRLRLVESSFDPSFLEVGTRIDNIWTAAKEKLGIKPSPEDKAELERFTDLKQFSVQNLSTILNALAGAAVSKQEEERITAGLPNAGTGITDGDSPTEFKRKLDNSTKQIKSALARYTYAQTFGISATSIPLAAMDKIIQEQGQIVEEQVRQQNPDFTGAQVEAETRVRLRQMFGL